MVCFVEKYLTCGHSVIDSRHFGCLYKNIFKLREMFLISYLYLFRTNVFFLTNAYKIIVSCLGYCFLFSVFVVCFFEVVIVGFFLIFDVVFCVFFFLILFYLLLFVILFLFILFCVCVVCLVLLQYSCVSTVIQSIFK